MRASANEAIINLIENDLGSSYGRVSIDLLGKSNELRRK